MSRLLRIVLWPALLLMFACGPVPEMVLPDTLSGSADSYEVSGARGSFLPFLFAQHVSFGPYRARAGVGIDSDEHSDATLFNGDVEHDSESQSGWFKLQGPEGSWSGRCIRKSYSEIAHAHSLEINQDGVKVRNPAISSTRSDVLRCDLREGGGHRWQLQLDLDWRRPGAGSVLSDGDKLVFGPTFERKHQPFGAGQEIAGYLIQDGTGPVGALDTGGNPRVWMSRRVVPKKRDLLAAICVALVVERRFMN